MSKKIIALTGAGISKASGIPTFEEVPGLKEKLTLDCRHNHPKEFVRAYEDMRYKVVDAEPNDAHFALNDFNVPVVTMNVDGLHQKAGSKRVYELHGNIIDDDVVLYGQPIRFFKESMDLIKSCGKGDILMIIGTSMKTSFANELRNLAIYNGMMVKEINENAETEVRKFLKSLG